MLQEASFEGNQLYSSVVLFISCLSAVSTLGEPADKIAWHSANRYTISTINLFCTLNSEHKLLKHNVKEITSYCYHSLMSLYIILQEESFAEIKEINRIVLWYSSLGEQISIHYTTGRKCRLWFYRFQMWLIYMVDFLDSAICLICSKYLIWYRANSQPR